VIEKKSKGKKKEEKKSKGKIPFHPSSSKCHKCDAFPHDFELQK